MAWTIGQERRKPSFYQPQRQKLTHYEEVSILSFAGSSGSGMRCGMNRLIQKVRSGELALGCQAQDPETVEMLAYCGVDFIWADMMWGSLDWSGAQEIVRSCEATNIGSLVRVQAEPWLQGMDKRAIADCHRVLTLGATGPIVSASCVEEIEYLVAVSQDWHRKQHIHTFSIEDYEDYKEQVISETFAVPIIEEADLFRDIERVLAIEGLKAVWLGLSDLSRELGHPFDYEHPDVWAAIDKTVAQAKERGIVVVGNVGWGSRTIDAQIERVLRLWDHGVGIVSMQHIVQPIYEHIIGTVRSRIG